MIKLTSEEIQKYLDSGVKLTLNLNEKEYILERDINYIIELNVDSAQTKTELGKYRLTLDDQTVFLTKVFNKLLKKLNDYKIIKINCFDSVEEYLEDLAFQSADMQYLLDKYSDCDSFSLCALVVDNSITQEEATRSLLENQALNKTKLQELYNTYKDQISEDFETIYREVLAECKEFQKTVKAKNSDEFYHCSFICDQVGQTTKYFTPTEFFWHLYLTLGMELDQNEELDKLLSSDKTSSISLLTTPEYAELKPYLIEFKYTFQTHCTTCGNLQIEMRFSLNEQTKRWLLKHKNDYDFDGELQDLAFYKNNKLRFSSCTHEGFHKDVTNVD